MTTPSYHERRSEIATYFDRTAVEAWSRLTSDAPVGRIRATVRRGREQMRALLLSWLPEDLSGCRLLDAGCGTGAFAFAAAQRGARVTAVDLAPNLIALARERRPQDLGPGTVELLAGDMLDPALGRFDHVVAMDSLIHYQSADMLRILGQLAARTERSILFTFAPRTTPLRLMHAMGRLFPRGNRAPAIEPISFGQLERRWSQQPDLAAWKPGRRERIACGFYTSEALELVRR